MSLRGLMVTGRSLAMSLAALAAGCGRVGFDVNDDANVLAPDALTCPSTYTLASGHCYRFTLTPTQPWLTAEQLCEADAAGAHLLVVDDAAELQAIAMLGSSDVSWIGLSDRVIEGDYRTVTGQAAFVNWQSGYPQATPDCVELGGTSGLMKSLDCTGNNEYLCEYDGLSVVPANF